MMQTNNVGVSLGSNELNALIFHRCEKMNKDKRMNVVCYFSCELITYSIALTVVLLHFTHKHIEAETKWKTFLRLHFQVDFPV